jgi:hypothetical protein
LKLPRQLQAALDRVSNSEIIHAAAAAAAPLPRKKTKISAGLWLQPTAAPLAASAAAAPADIVSEWAAAQANSSTGMPPKLQLHIPSSVPPSHVRVQVHSGIIDAAAAGPISSLSLDPHAAQTLQLPLSRSVFPPPAAADARSVAVTLTRYMDRLLQQLPDSAMCRAMLQVARVVVTMFTVFQSNSHFVAAAGWRKRRV